MSPRRSRSGRLRERRSKIRRAERRLVRSRNPRLEMLAILVLTGAFGFLVSWGLLHLGLSALWIRYPLAVASAYGMFLLLLRFWLAYQRGRRERQGDSPDLSDLLDPSVPDAAGGVARGARAAGRMVGGGGRFGGAGASGSYEGPMPLPVGDPQAASATVGDSGSSGGAKGIGSLFDLASADENTLPLVVVLAVLAALLSLVLAVVYLIWTAPALLAEVLVDGLVVAALSHRLKRIDSPSWVGAVLRRTWLPATGVALTLGLTGYLLQRFDPAIDSIGDVVALFGRG